MILHIANDFSGSTVYKNLVLGLDDLNVSQVVYTAIRNKNLIGKNKVDFRDGDSKIIYSHVLNKYVDRLLYKRKISKIYKDILEKVDFTKITYIHAHTWYSDGGVAYLLSKKFNIPFGVAIRNTDINIFYKYFIHERKFGLQILEKASDIFFISQIYKERMAMRMVGNKKVAEKYKLIPNGVHEFWITNPSLKKTVGVDSSLLNLVFVGKLTKNKNIIRVMKAVVYLNTKRGIKCKLRIAGGKGNAYKDVLKLIEKYKEYNFFELIGFLDSHEEMQRIYKMSDLFVLPSKAETFGLVYVEAMLCGLPIIYTRNEGLDGFYTENIGEGVNWTDIEGIVNAVIKIKNNYNSYVIPLDKILDNHDWNKIALEYSNVYKINHK